MSEKTYDLAEELRLAEAKRNERRDRFIKDIRLAQAEHELRLAQTAYERAQAVYKQRLAESGYEDASVKEKEKGD